MKLTEALNKKELDNYMSKYGNHVNVSFGTNWALRNAYEGTYYLVTYSEKHQRNTYNDSVESEVKVNSKEAFDFILKTKRDETLNKILEK